MGIDKLQFLFWPWQSLRGLETLSLKDYIVNILYFAGHKFSFTITQLCCCNINTDNTQNNECGCTAITLLINTCFGPSAIVCWLPFYVTNMMILPGGDWFHHLDHSNYWREVGQWVVRCLLGTSESYFFFCRNLSERSCVYSDGAVATVAVGLRVSGQKRMLTHEQPSQGNHREIVLLTMVKPGSNHAWS